MDDRMRECTIYTRQEEEVAVNEVMDRAEAFASAAGPSCRIGKSR